MTTFTEFKELSSSTQQEPSSEGSFASFRDIRSEQQGPAKGVSEGPVELYARGLLFGVERVGAGIQELGRAAVTDITGIDVISDFKEMRMEREGDFARYLDRMTELEHRIFWMGGYTGELGSAAALPAKTATQALGSAMFLGASMPTTGSDASLVSQERTMNATMAVAGTAAADTLIKTGQLLSGKLVTDPLKKATKFFSRKGGQEEATVGVALEEVKAPVEAAERLGVRITPAEASASPVLKSREARAISHLNQDKTLQVGRIKTERDRELARSVDSFVTSIIPEGRKAVRNQLDRLYVKAFKVRMSPKFIERVEANEIYSSAKKNMLKDPAIKQLYNELGEGSLGQVEMVRREISKQAHSSAISVDSVQRNKARPLQSINKMLKGALKSSSVEFERALPIAQRQIAQKRILDDLSKIKTKATEEGTSVYNATPIQFYDAILSTPAQRKELKRQLKEVGGSAQAIDDLSVVLSSIKETPFKALNVSSDKGFGMATGGFGKEGVVVHNTTSFLRGRHNLAMVEVITNGKWQNSLTKVKAIKDPAKRINALATVLGYVTADNIKLGRSEEGEE